MTSHIWEGSGFATKVAHHYNENGAVAETERYAGAEAIELVSRSLFEYDARQRVVNAVHSNSLDEVLASYDYVWSPGGRLVEWTHHDQTTQFNRDGGGQLLGATHSGSQADEQYVFDANGNRVSAGEVIAAGDRLTSDSAVRGVIVAAEVWSIPGVAVHESVLALWTGKQSALPFVAFSASWTLTIDLF